MNAVKYGHAAYSIARLYLKDPSGFRRLRHIRPGEERYVRPARAYDLPPYEPSMRTFASEEQYLRPTRLCNPRAPEVVALAHQLGAFEKSDREYAEAAFSFAKEKLQLEICPVDSVEETLRRGTGTCFQLISVFIALCRAAGIKARYKMFSQTMIQAWREVMVDVDPLVKQWYDSMGYFVLEGEGEAFVDGRWTVAHVGPTAARQAAADIPVTRFGEDSIGVWFQAVPGSIKIMESMPMGLGPGSSLLMRIAPGSVERVNVSVEKQVLAGGKKIEAAGGVEAYDAMVRRQRGPAIPALELHSRDEIVFQE